MANLHTELITFHDRIALTSAKKATLRTARDAIRERVRKYFRESLKSETPKFRGQGSYAMVTTINPIDGEYDIDDGIYLQHLNRQDSSDWPTPETVHLWVFNATDGHTNEKPMNKKTCVRVKYAGQYHVDLPIYAELNGNYYLAECGARGWHASDPLALTDWFVSALKTHGEQLRRVVRYLKSWADFQSQRRGKMPSGLILTVCAVRNFVSDERDDIALAQTLNSIKRDVDAIVYILNPVDITEELTAHLTEVQKQRFQEAIREAAAEAKEATEMVEAHKASKLWRKQLGGRFTLIQEPGNKDDQKQTAAGIAASYAGTRPPKPWGWR